MNNNYLIHFGNKNSGRYPRGSGERPNQHDGLNRTASKYIGKAEYKKAKAKQKAKDLQRYGGIYNASGPRDAYFKSLSKSEQKRELERVKPLVETINKKVIPMWNKKIKDLRNADTRHEAKFIYKAADGYTISDIKRSNTHLGRKQNAYIAGINFAIRRNKAWIDEYKKAVKEKNLDKQAEMVLDGDDEIWLESKSSIRNAAKERLNDRKSDIGKHQYAIKEYNKDVEAIKNTKSVKAARQIYKKAKYKSGIPVGSRAGYIHTKRGQKKYGSK